jgi:hypothetical protein
LLQTNLPDVDPMQFRDAILETDEAVRRLAGRIQRSRKQSLALGAVTGASIAAGIALKAQNATLASELSTLIPTMASLAGVGITFNQKDPSQDPFYFPYKACWGGLGWRHR